MHDDTLFESGNGFPVCFVDDTFPFANMEMCLSEMEVRRGETFDKSFLFSLKYFYICE